MRTAANEVILHGGYVVLNICNHGENYDTVFTHTHTHIYIYIYIYIYIQRVINLKLDHQLSRECFTSDAIYNSSAGMT
jgi:hypothetical protein